MMGVVWMVSARECLLDGKGVILVEEGMDGL